MTRRNFFVHQGEGGCDDQGKYYCIIRYAQLGRSEGEKKQQEQNGLVV